MKSTLNGFANYGIEDADLAVAAPVVDPELPVIDETKTDEVAELETEVVENEVAEVEGDIEEMTDTVESLEAICMGIRSTLKRGGMNRQAAAFALQSADLQLARLGLEGIKVAVEDFEEAPTAVAEEAPATEAAPEAPAAEAAPEAPAAESAE